MSKLIRFVKNEDGATAIEYGLIAALISVAIVGASIGCLLARSWSVVFTAVSTAEPLIR